MAWPSDEVEGEVVDTLHTVRPEQDMAESISD